MGCSKVINAQTYVLTVYYDGDNVGRNCIDEALDDCPVVSSSEVVKYVRVLVLRAVTTATATICL